MIRHAASSHSVIQRTVAELESPRPGKLWENDKPGKRNIKTAEPVWKVIGTQCILPRRNWPREDSR